MYWGFAAATAATAGHSCFDAIARKGLKSAPYWVPAYAISAFLSTVGTLRVYFTSVPFQVFPTWKVCAEVIRIACAVVLAAATPAASLWRGLAPSCEVRKAAPSWIPSGTVTIFFAPIVKIVAVTVEAGQISPSRWVIFASVRTSARRFAVTPNLSFTCFVLDHTPGSQRIIVRIATKVSTGRATWRIPHLRCVPFPAALATRPRKPNG
mmetsp:Transcript_57177/g.110405  ORF Transcript_57177/g.110405 Transcript_57177/m.110405 type:complete len:209 (+) Transcript_57177:336-962(+)